MMLQLSGSVINPWGCHDTQSVTVVLTLTVVTPTWSVTAYVEEMIKNIFNLILWLIFIFLLPFYISSEAVHAWDDGSGCSDGSGGSGGRERLESEPGGPERSHVGEVRASDQPWRYTELLLPVMFCVFRSSCIKHKDVSAFVLCRKWVSVRSVEEGGAEVHELGDDGAGR